MNNILEIEKLAKKYPKSDFELKDVSFSVPYGAIVGFVGENGAGKTTTISDMLNTICRDGGTVKVFGKELTDQSTALREDIGVVFDAVNFSENLTAAKLAKVMAGIYKQWDGQEFARLLKQFDLPYDKKFKTLVLIGLVCSALIVILFIAAGHEVKTQVLAFSYFWGLAFAIFTGSFIYPLILKFGAIKSELIIIVSAMASMALIVGVWLGIGAVVQWSGLGNILAVGVVSIIASIICFVISYFVSVGIHRKKEF